MRMHEDRRRLLRAPRRVARGLLAALIALALLPSAGAGAAPAPDDGDLIGGLAAATRDASEENSVEEGLSPSAPDGAEGLPGDSADAEEADGPDDAEEADGSASEGADDSVIGSDAGGASGAPAASDAAASASPSDPVSDDADPLADGTLYVSASGSDQTGDGTRAKPLATLQAAVQKAPASATVVVIGNLSAAATAAVGAKSIVVTSDSGQSAPSVVTASSATLFTVGTGSLSLSNIVIDGASSPSDHRAVEATGGGARIVLGSGATIRNWNSTNAAGAVRVNANGASLVMETGSSIEGCRLVTQGAQTGGAAVSVMAGRAPGTLTAPSASNRASFTMKSGSSIVDCDTQLTANGALSGGGAVHAADAVVSIEAGAAVRSCDLSYRAASGALIDLTGTRQGGGGLFANNCKVDMAGTIEACNVVGSVNTSTDSFYAGGGGVYLYDYGCTTGAGVDCRTVVSGTISNCSAIAGGGVFYWSEADGYGEGDNLWVGANGAPLTSASQVVDKVYDTVTLAGSIEGCSTTDEGTRRTISLGSYGDFERYGIGGGAICGAFNGLIVLADGSHIAGCSTHSEGGGVSNYGVSVFCLDGSANLSGGPVIENCTSGKIAGGLSAGAASHIESVRVSGCAAGAFGGGMYLYSGSTTMYNCSVTGCTAGEYGGGIMQDVVHDLFWYGGTVTGNRAGSGGGGVALYGFAGGTASAPRGLVFNYPVTANGGYTNPAYYKSAILAGKIVAPSIVRGNVQGAQGAQGAASDVWTNSYYPSSRISVSGSFVEGSKVGVRVSDGLASLNQSGARFGSVYDSSADLAPFANDVDPTLVAAASGTNLVWASGFTVEYRANVPAGAALSGEAPFDGADGMANAYARAGGAATVLGQGTMAVEGYAFKGWAAASGATEARYQPGAKLSYDAALDPAKNGRLVLYAVWEELPRVCQIIRDADGDGVPDTFFRAYETLSEAFRAVQENDRIEMLRDAPLVDFSSSSAPGDGGVSLASGVGGVVLTTAPLAQTVAGAMAWQGGAPSSGSPVATIERTSSGATASWFSVAGGLALENVAVDGACTTRQAQEGAGIAAEHALFEVSGASSSLAVGKGAVLRDARNAAGAGGAVRAFGGAAVRLSAGGLISGCTAADGGGVSVQEASFEQDGGSVQSCVSASTGGGVHAGPGASVALSGSAEVRANTAGRTGGGLYVDAAAHLTMTGGVVSGNAAAAEDGGGSFEDAHVGGVALGQYAGGDPLVEVGGTASVSGNLGRAPGGSASDDPIPSDLETARSGSSWALAVDASGLSSTASVGVTSADPVLLVAGARFASCAGTPSEEALAPLFNDADAGLVAAMGAGGAVVWRAEHTDVSFTKVGADQRTGDAVKLGGAKFSLYRYVGSVEIGPFTINGGSVDLASTSSPQWAPVIAADGTVGAAGDESNVPYVFESSSDADALGQVVLTQVAPATWYMLVEVGAPEGFQLPTGQWAFQAVELSGSGGYGIDTGTLLARNGDGGLPPPAFSTSIDVNGSVEGGVFLSNVARYDLPSAGTGGLGPLAVALAGLALLACAFALHRARPGRP